MMKSTIIPTKNIGPIKIVNDDFDEEIIAPLATYETPLWPSVNRGALVSRLSGGIHTTLIKNCMTRSVIFRTPDAKTAFETIQSAKKRRKDMQQAVSKHSRFVKLIDMHYEIVGYLLYVRFEFFTGDASGHNMVTQAAENLMEWFLQEYPSLKYSSISGNYCTDKKVSAVNGILGRGKYIVAEITISREVCQKVLKTTPEAIKTLCVEKNLIGSILAGSTRSANAHFANMLLAFYLATGQDAANIVEGSQGIVHAEIRQDHLYFSVTLPNLIMGTVGNGKDLDFVRENLAQLGCLANDKIGSSANRLAIIASAVVLCGELSLLAAQTVPGTLMRSHRTLERKHKK